MKTLFFFLSTVLLSAFAFGSLDPETVWHTKIGDIDFYSIQDGANEMNNRVLLTEDKDAPAKLSPTGKTPSGFGAFVVKKGTDVALIDTGVGGRLLVCLQSIGIKPEDVKHVFITHSHGDHVGGLVKDGKKVFPNATLYLDERELTFWKSGRAKEQCEQCLQLYGEPKFLKPDEKTTVVFPELVAIDLAGHTPGHVGFLLSGDDKKILIAGDLLHHGAVQFARPDISVQYDSDPKVAAAVRAQTLHRAAGEKLLFAAAHLAFPAVGHVTDDGKGFRFTPVE